ncbi:hypothetical protein RRG08_046759 [Elysia crispata]|uniref:Uncharacterized protein n=1 Tax=Elysia crispata TaxID=231223 RepID=A0AAE0ZVF7_9GAST|nr:hypothetical protein RRG08_046759 [Elysia crispata]
MSIKLNTLKRVDAEMVYVSCAIIVKTDISSSQRLERTSNYPIGLQTKAEIFTEQILQIAGVQGGARSVV